MSRLIKKIIDKTLADNNTKFNILYIPNNSLFDLELFQTTEHQYYILGENPFKYENVHSYDPSVLQRNISLGFDLIINTNPFDIQSIKSSSELCQQWQIRGAFIHHEIPSGIKKENIHYVTKDLTLLPNFVANQEVKDGLMLFDATIIDDKFSKYILPLVKNHAL